MKTITTPNKYQCEVCRFMYADKDMAIACESQQDELIDCFGKFNIGDAVWVRTRYDGWFLDNVTNTKILPNKVYFTKVFNSVVAADCAKSHYHKIEVITANEWEVSKDGDCTNEWGTDEIIKDSDIEWQSGAIPADTEIFAAFEYRNGLNCKFIIPTDIQSSDIIKWALITYDTISNFYKY